MNDAEKRIAESSGVPNARVAIHNSIDSTNSEARRLAESGTYAPTLVIARQQSAGRGRMGRSFYSPKDSGLYMTALFEANESLVSTVLMTTSAAVAAARSIEALSGIKVEIKWVNDLYLNEKKICGILCEAFEACGRRFICIGIGINLFTKDFPEELAAIAGSLGVERDIKDELAARVFCELWRSYHTDERGDMLAYYKEHSLVIGKPIYFIEDGKKHFGVARDIDEFGHLCVTLEDGSEKILSSGEITLRLDMGE